MKAFMTDWIERRRMMELELPIEEIANRVVEKLKTAEHDGCEGCVFADVEEWEMPCCKCKHGCKDYWRAKGC